MRFVESMHDIVVMSDLHLGRGLDPETRRYHLLETFFYDEDFKRFCQYICDDVARRGAALRLVLNGDVFDLLRIDPEAPSAESNSRERRFGPTLTPAVAARTVEQILAGHPVFVQALAYVLSMGHDIVLLPGNHDLEMQWEQPQDVLRDAVRVELLKSHGTEKAAEALSRLKFKPWFHHEPGRIWIEHGCQYDPDNAFRFPLRRPLAKEKDEVFLAERDMPFGNFIQRYLYNAFGNITFIVPTTRANARYIKWLLLNEPRLLIYVITRYVPFALQLLRRVARSATFHSQELENSQSQELTRLAQESGLGDKLYTIDGLKHVGADVVRVAGEFVRQTIRLSIAAIGVTLAGAGLWALGSQAITEMKMGLAPKAVLSVALNSLVVGLLIAAVIYWLLRIPEDPSPGPLRRTAKKIAELLDVPLVTFGHTHDEVITPLPRPERDKGWYFNTGTWIAVFTHDVLLPRDRVQFTFLRVRGNEGELLHWSPGRREAIPVILLEERGPLSSSYAPDGGS
jgi:UDP-2,3-diacylglucosamine pyrophosphatase LpxH